MMNEELIELKRTLKWQEGLLELSCSKMSEIEQELAKLKKGKDSCLGFISTQKEVVKKTKLKLKRAQLLALEAKQKQALEKTQKDFNQL